MAPGDQGSQNPTKPRIGTSAAWKKGAPPNSGQKPQEVSRTQAEPVSVDTAQELQAPPVQHKPFVPALRQVPKVNGLTSRPTPGFFSHVRQALKRAGRKGSQNSTALFSEGYWLRYLALRPDLKCVAAILNHEPGASRTTTTVGIGSALAFWSRKTVYAMPATTAFSRKTIATVAGIRSETVPSVADYCGMLPVMRNALDVSSRVLNNQAGLHVIDDAHRSLIQQALDAEAELGMFTAVASHVRPMTDFLLFDTGRDQPSERGIPVAAMEMADVAVFTASADDLRTTVGLTVTREAYRNQNGSRRIFNSEGLPTWFNQLSNSTKARTGITVISKVKAGETIPSDVTPSEESSQVIPVPYDQSVAHNEKVDIDELAEETFLAYTACAARMLETVASLRGIILPDRSSLPEIPEEYRYA